MIEFFAEIDADLLLFFNSLRHPCLDHFVKAFSGRAVWIPLYIVIAAMIVRCYGWRSGVVYVLAAGAAVGLSDLVCNDLIRPWVGRLRPSNPDNPLSAAVQIVDGYRSGSYGFPSCHAANTFALALSTSLLCRARGYAVFIFLWALCQCYSRLYLGVHYPGDLLAGACVGSLFGYLAYRGVRLLPLYRRDGEHTKTAAIPVIAVGMATVILNY